MGTDVLRAMNDLRRLVDLEEGRSPLEKPAEPAAKGAPMVIAMYLLQDALYRLQPSIERFLLSFSALCSCCHPKGAF